jgi:hypothetical protein
VHLDPHAFIPQWWKDRVDGWRWQHLHSLWRLAKALPGLEHLHPFGGGGTFISV